MFLILSIPILRNCREWFYFYLISDSEIFFFRIEGQACRVPVLDVHSSEILRLLKTVPPVRCNKSRDWVDVIGSVIKISPWVKQVYGDVECSFTDIIRETDFKQHQGITTTTHTEYNLEASDVVTARCVSETGIV